MRLLGQTPSLRQFSTPFEWFDVATLLAGGTVAAVFWLAATCAGAAALWRRPNGTVGIGLLLGASIFTPLALAVLRPDGMTYEYGRYMLITLPYLMLLMSAAVFQGLVAAGRWRKLHDGAAQALALTIGVALVIVNMAMGPRGVRHVPDGRFANTYLSMMPLPAFNVPWSGTPQFYKWLAQQNRAFSIVESPPILDRGLHLYRQYYLQHRHPVLIGEFSAPRVIPAATPIVWPMIHVDDPVALVASGADYVIVHYRCAEEIRAYLHEVGTAIWPRLKDSGVQSLMYRNLTGGWVLEPPRALLEMLDRAFGPPVFEDHYVIVWRIRAAAEP